MEEAQLKRSKQVLQQREGYTLDKQVWLDNLKTKARRGEDSFIEGLALALW